MPSQNLPPAVQFREFGFRYDDGYEVFAPFSLSVPQGSRTLLLGANGVGKSTLLRILAGRHLVAEGALQVFGHSPFYGLSLAADISLIDGDFPIHIDIRVRELLAHPTPSVDPKRQAELIELLGVKPDWRMCKVSEGQRRRVQLLLALRKPVKLLLLDEVTAHLDVVMRSDLIAWLKGQSERFGLTTLYATHILDGLWTEDPWPTHLLSLKFSEPPLLQSLSEIGPLSSRERTLLSYCESEIREDLKQAPLPRE